MYLSTKRIKKHILCQTWEEAITNACSLLETDDIVTSQYAIASINAVNELGPYFVIAPKIMMAHARPEEGAKKNGLSFISLSEEIDCLGVPIKYVFALSAVGDDEHINMIQKLVSVLEHDNIYDILENNPDQLENLFN